MKRLTSITTSFLLASLLITTSCNLNKKQTSENGSLTAETSIDAFACMDSIHLINEPDSILHIEYKFQFLKSSSSQADSINASIAQVLVSGERNTDIRQAILDAMSQEESAMQKEIQEYYEPDDETYGSLQYNIVRTGHFVHDAADTVVAYKASIDMYTGGAHGSYTPITLNFSRNTGKLIQPSDIFDMEQEQAILDLMLAKLLKDNGCSTREELMEKTSLLTLGELSLTSNFHLGRKGATFCFGQYEIAPYSSGITYITLDYDTLKPYMKKKTYMELINKYFPNITSEQRERFAALDALYRDWNSKINVISRKDIDNLYEHHILHSLGIAQVIKFKPGTRVMDLGTGGGFPGIPLAIMFPDVHFHLVDSIGKKIRVCDEVRTALGLTNVPTEWTRGENLKDKYDFVVSRAVMPLTDLVKLVRKNISPKAQNAMPNGLICLKGGELEHEVLPMKTHTLITSLSDYFEEEFFETKKVVYVSL